MFLCINISKTILKTGVGKLAYWHQRPVQIDFSLHATSRLGPLLRQTLDNYDNFKNIMYILHFSLIYRKCRTLAYTYHITSKLYLFNFIKYHIGFGEYCYGNIFISERAMDAYCIIGENYVIHSFLFQCNLTVIFRFSCVKIINTVNSCRTIEKQS